MTNFQTARESMVDCQVRPSDVTKYPKTLSKVRMRSAVNH